MKTAYRPLTPAERTRSYITLGCAGLVAVMLTIGSRLPPSETSSASERPAPISRSADESCADFAVSTNWLSSEMSSKRTAYQTCVLVQQRMDAERRAVRQ